MPTWVLAMTLLLASMMIFMAGVILDSVARGRNEVKRIHYLSIAPSTTAHQITTTGKSAEQHNSDPVLKAIK